MKFEDLSKLLSKTSKNDILSQGGLQVRESATGNFFGSLGIFVAGVAVGGAAALLLAPKAGRELRDDLLEKAKEAKENIGSRASSLLGSETSPSAESSSRYQGG